MIQTPEQQQFLQKLLGFQFSIEYKAGKHNTVTDALSRRDDHHLSALYPTVSGGCFKFLDEVRKENVTCPELCLLHDKLRQRNLDEGVYSVKDGLMYFNKKLLLSPN